MRRNLYMILLVLVLSSCSRHRLTKKGVYKEVPPQEFLSLVESNNVNIIDVRTKSEYKKSHIKGARNASYFSGKFKKKLDNLALDTAKTTLIYCETQHRSLFVAKKLYKKGFTKIIDLDKGMMHWRKQNFPYVSDSVLQRD